MTTALKESEIEQRCALRVLLERCEHKVHGCGGMSGQFRVSFGSFSFSRVFFWSRCNPLPSPPRKGGPVTTGVYWIPAFAGMTVRKTLLTILMLMGRMECSPDEPTGREYARPMTGSAKSGIGFTFVSRISLRSSGLRLADRSACHALIPTSFTMLPAGGCVRWPAKRAADDLGRDISDFPLRCANPPNGFVQRELQTHSRHRVRRG